MPQSAIPPGRHAPVRPDWLDKRREEILEPDLPIVDPHHHMWDRPGNRYLFQDLLADVGSGHNIVATCFEECREMYRADGPQEQKSLGETEFVNGIAAMSASGKYGPTRCIAGIIGNVDLRIGRRAKGILEQHVAISGGRFKGIRNGATWHDDPSLSIYCSGAPQGLYRDRNFREGFAGLASLGLSLRRLAVPYAAERCGRSGARLSAGDDRAQPCRRGARDRPLCRQARGGLCGMARRRSARSPASPNTYVKLGGLGMKLTGFTFFENDMPPSSRGSGEGVAPLYRDLHQRLRPAALDVREQFSGRQGHVQLSGDVERLQTHRRRLLRRREDGVVQRRCDQGLPSGRLTQMPLTPPSPRIGASIWAARHAERTGRRG